MKIVIIGGTAGGAGIAARLRRLDEQAEIIIVEKNPYISWSGCALPYFTGGIISERNNLFLANKEMFDHRFNIKVLDSTKAVGLDRAAKTVSVLAVNQPHAKVTTISYDKLVIATGAGAIMPGFAQNKDGVYAMRCIEDADQIKAYVAAHDVKHAVVVGGGFIGLEACENLKHRGIEVTLVEKAPQVLAPVDPDIAQYLHRELDQHGVSLKLGVGIADIAKTEAGLTVSLDNGESVETQLVIMALGIVPQTDFIKDSGLTLNSRGYIEVADTMQTNDPDIYALGDVVAVQGVPEDRLGTIALAGPASKQSRIAAHNLLGIGLGPQGQLHFKGSLGVSIVRVMSLTAGAVGMNRRALQGQPDVAEVTVHTPHHVSWFEEAKPVHLKLIFNQKTGLVLGAQAVGEVSIDKNLEVISALMQMHATVYDLVDFESAYAPPFSAPRSPVNMAGSTAANVVDGLEEMITIEQFDELRKNDPDLVCIDVRAPDEIEICKLPGFTNIPVDALRAHHKKQPFDPNKTYVVSCQVGVRGHTAACMLRHFGVKKVYNLSGGYVSWCTAHYQLKH